MEQNGVGGNQNMPPATLCRNGCGFYGNAAFDGMCSKCYKDHVKRRQQNTSPSGIVASGRASPAGKRSSSSLTSALGVSMVETSMPSTSSISTAASTAGMHDMSLCDTSTMPSIETATPTVPSATSSSSGSQDKTSSDDQLEGATGESDVAADSKKDDSGDKDRRPKKNRCHTCKKKVGLTGFQCRCGGLFCSLHRYSDKHDCTFDYKAMAQQQIRKHNPVVVGEKIQKI